jgi:formylglycine-generating enzyme required for sulfatase activity
MQIGDIMNKSQSFINSIGMKMKLIPAGEFIMGDKRIGNMKKVSISKSFYLGIFPVVQKEWELIMGKWQHSIVVSKEKVIGGCENPVDENVPICCISWLDCKGFIGRLNKKENTTKYRLPTEVEWEYACRAGSSTLYYYGDDKNEEYLDTYAWFGSNSMDSTHPVGKKTPNKWDLFDMLGNVWEWCADEDDLELFFDSNKKPIILPSGTHRILRGGGYEADADECTCASRIRVNIDDSGSALGFRLAMSM